MEVLIEGGRETLLAGAEPLVASGPAGAEVPAVSFLGRCWVDGEVLTQHVAAADNVAGLSGSVHAGALLIAMGTGLQATQTKERDAELKLERSDLITDIKYCLWNCKQVLWSM